MSENPIEAATAAPGEKRSAGRPRKTPAVPPASGLAKASESGDPAIHKILADRWAAQQNAAQAAGDQKASDAVIAGHEAHIAALNRELNDLGFE